MASDKVNSIIESIETLNVLELVELKKSMEEKWGVTAAAPVMVGGAVPAAAAGGDGAAAVALHGDVVENQRASFPRLGQVLRQGNPHKQVYLLGSSLRQQRGIAPIASGLQHLHFQRLWIQAHVVVTSGRDPR